MLALSACETSAPVGRGSVSDLPIFAAKNAPPRLEAPSSPASGAAEVEAASRPIEPRDSKFVDGVAIEVPAQVAPTPSIGVPPRTRTRPDEFRLHLPDPVDRQLSALYNRRSELDMKIMLLNLGPDAAGARRYYGGGGGGGISMFGLRGSYGRNFAPPRYSTPPLNGGAYSQNMWSLDERFRAASREYSEQPDSRYFSRQKDPNIHRQVDELLRQRDEIDAKIALMKKNRGVGGIYIPFEETPAKSAARRASGKSSAPISPSPNSPKSPDSMVQLEPAKYAWNTPDTMTLSQSTFVEVRVTLDPSRFAGLAKRLAASGVVGTADVNLSRILIAKLESTAFKVDPKEGQRQQVLDGRDTVWRWAIEPTVAGDHELVLKIVSELEPASVIESAVRSIKVRAVPAPEPDRWQSLLDFAVKNWEKLLTVVLIPVLGGFWSLMKRRRTARLDSSFPAINPS